MKIIVKSKKGKAEYLLMYFALEIQWWLFHTLLKNIPSQLTSRQVNLGKKVMLYRLPTELGLLGLLNTSILC